MDDLNQQKLQLFETIAKSRGISDEQIAPYLELGKIKLQEANQPYNPAKDETLQRQIEYGKLTGAIPKTPTDSMITGQDAYSEVIKQGGRDLIKGKTKAERETEAETILSFGGVSDYRQKASLKDIYTDAQSKANDAATSLLQDVGVLQQIFPVGTKADIWMKGNLTGPIAARKGFLRTGKQIQAQAMVQEMSTQKIKELSGVAVSPKEMERLRGFLPDARDQENEVANKLDALDRGIRMNMAIRDEAARTGKTESEVFAQKKDMYYQQFGFDPKNPKSDTATYGNMPETPFLQNGQSDDIDAFLNSF